MTINLTYETQLPPRYRFLVKDSWKSATWSVLPTPLSYSPTAVGGFILDEVSQRALPAFSHCTFHYNLGVIDGRSFPSSGTEDSSIILNNKIVRLQLAPGSDDPSYTPTWVTVFIGVVEQTETKLAPGADSLLGTRTYYAQDLLCSFLTKSRVDHSAMYSSGITYGYTYGHPGFNTRDGDGRLLGNLDHSLNNIGGADPSSLPWAQDNLSSLSSFYQSILCHSMAGAGDTWTDLQALQNILGISRLPFAPWFQVRGATDLLSTATAWEVPVGVSAWDMVNRILDRRRGRGLAVFEWTESDPLADPTALYITLYAQTADNITWTKPAAGGSGSINGATANGTTTTVDLQGDHRNIAGMFTLGDEAQHKYNYVEVVGDPIQVLATLDYASSSLDKRWGTVDETNFVAATALQRRTGKYDLVWQMHGLPSGWTLTGGDGGVGSQTGIRVDYRCSDSGAISVPAAGFPYDTAPNLITVLGDLPIFQGWDYTTSTPARYDGTTETQAPVRRPPLLLVRTPNLSTTDRYYSGQDVYSCQMHVSQYGISVVHADDVGRGVRFFSGNSSVGGALQKEHIVITVGLELPHRIRLASGDPKGGRKQLIRLRGYALWLAHPGAVWQLSETSPDGSGWKGMRNACAGTGNAPGILRDDRDRLAAMAALAFSWYLTPRRSASWALKGCGFLPSFQTVASDGVTTTDVTYPTVGKVVTSLTAGGQAWTLNTPVSDCVYTATGNGITTWQTDWQDLNLQ